MDRSVGLLEGLENMKSKVKLIHYKREEGGFYFIGPTGAGKSTLINCLVGNKLECQKKGPSIFLFPCQEGSAKIGNNAGQSCTRLPSTYQDQKGNKYIDSPGFGDTNGGNTTIQHSYSLAQMFRIGNKVKVIIVIDINTLKGKKHLDFISTLDKIWKMFNRDKNILSSCLIVLTKVDTREDTYQQIKQMIREVMTQNFQSRIFLQYLLKLNYILLFPRFDLILNPQEFIGQLKQKLNNHKKFPFYEINKEVQIVLDPSAILHFRKTIDSVTDSFNALAKKFDCVIESNFPANSNNQQVLQANFRKILSAKLNLEECLEKPSTLSLAIEKVHKISTELSLPKSIENEFQTNFKKMQFCKTLQKDLRFNSENKVSEKFLNSLNKKLQNLDRQMTQLQSFKQITENITEKIIAEESQHRQQLRSIYKIGKSENKRIESFNFQSSKIMQQTADTFKKQSEQKLKLLNQTVQQGINSYRNYVVIIQTKCMIM